MTWLRRAAEGGTSLDKNRALLSRSQLALITWVALLSPVVRQAPLALVRIAGNSAWLGALFTGVTVFLPLLAPHFLLRCRKEGEGLGERLCAALGKRLGSLLVFVLVAWLLVYAAFVLASGADRFVAAVYPGSRPGVFMLIMAGLGLMAGLGQPKVLGRCAQVVQPVLLGIFLLVFACALPQVNWQALGPAQRQDLLPALQAALYEANILSVGVYAALLESHTQPGRLLPPLLTPLLWMLLILTLLCVVSVGIFGEALTAQLQYPFFVVLRNIRFFRVLERVETLVIAQWVAADFILISLLMHGCSHSLQRLFGGERRLWAVVCSVLSLALAFLCAPTSFELMALSERIMPACNAVVVFGVLPLVCVIGLLRRRL